MKGGRVAALRVPNGSAITRSEIDAYTEFVKIYGAKGLAYIKINDINQLNETGLPLCFDSSSIASRRRRLCERGVIMLELCERGVELIFPEYLNGSLSALLSDGILLSEKLYP